MCHLEWPRGRTRDVRRTEVMGGGPMIGSGIASVEAPAVKLPCRRRRLMRSRMGAAESAVRQAASSQTQPMTELFGSFRPFAIALGCTVALIAAAPWIPNSEVG